MSALTPPCGQHAHRRVSHDEDRGLRHRARDVLDPPLEVGQLERAARLAVVLVRAAVRLVERGAPEAAHVVREDGDAALGEARVHVLVAADVVCEAVDEDEDGLGRADGRVGARVEVVAVEAVDPSLGELCGGHVVDRWAAASVGLGEADEDVESGRRQGLGRRRGQESAEQGLRAYVGVHAAEESPHMISRRLP